MEVETEITARLERNLKIKLRNLLLWQRIPKILSWEEKREANLNQMNRVPSGLVTVNVILIEFTCLNTTLPFHPRTTQNLNLNAFSFIFLRKRESARKGKFPVQKGINKP